MKLSALSKFWKRNVRLSVKQTAAILGTAGIIAFGCSAIVFGDRDKVNTEEDRAKTVLPGVSVSADLNSAVETLPGPGVESSVFRPHEPLTVYGALDLSEEEKQPEEPEEIENDTVGEIVIEVESVEPEPENDYVIDLTDQEFDMMCSVVMSEVGYCDEQLKLAIANVIINRVKSDRFPDTVYEVLHQKNQFGAIDNYYTKRLVPDESVIDCVKRALSGEGGYIVNGATFYYTPGVSSAKAAQWFESLCYCATVGNGRFFKAW